MATLTEVKSDQITDLEAVPSVKLDASHSLGNIRVLRGSYTVDAADEFGTSGLIRLFEIPEGARLLDVQVSMPASGATGIFNLGWAAGANGDEAADDDGIIALADPGGAALERQAMLSTVPGYLKKFSEAVEVQADFTEATADSGGDTLEVIAYIAIN